MDFAALVHHLLVHQRASMLDRTKCSVTACGIYNYLCAGGDGGGGYGGGRIAWNDNLVGAAPNWAGFAAAAAAAAASAAPTVYYAHLDHITGETSHYWIVVQRGDAVMLLQSAVFEFSIRDWLFPDDAEAEAAAEHAAGVAAAAADADAYGDDEHARAYAAARLAAATAGLDATLRSRRGVMARVRAAGPWARGAAVPLADFLARFVPAVASLEGEWPAAPADVAARCAAYEATFGCRLDAERLARLLRVGGVRPAAVKWVSAPLRR
jgi:pyruvate/2-oxoglutarate dehydrogenase complex dihydrolipoamide acyltransferase (E2) component